MPDSTSGAEFSREPRAGKAKDEKSFALFFPLFCGVLGAAFPMHDTANFQAEIILTAGKHRPKPGLFQDAGDFFPFVTLDLDAAFFDCSARPADFLHFLGQHLLFR